MFLKISNHRSSFFHVANFLLISHANSTIGTSVSTQNTQGSFFSILFSLLFSLSLMFAYLSQLSLELLKKDCWFPSQGDVTRLDGARGKKQVWRPHVRNWGLSEGILLYWRKYLWNWWDFSAPPEEIWLHPHWFGAPIMIRRQGNCAPLLPRRYAPVPSITIFTVDRVSVCWNSPMVEKFDTKRNRFVLQNCFDSHLLESFEQLKVIA